MEALIKVHIDELTTGFLENLKQMFAGKKLEIKVVEEADEMDATEFILSNPAYAEELDRRIAEYEKTKQVITVNPDDLL